MMEILAGFEKLCKSNFRFLQRYGFSLIKSEREPYGVFMTYANSTTAVRISYEPREGGIFVLLGRLRKGGLPKYPIFIYPETSLDSFHLEDVVSIRAGNIQWAGKAQKAVTAAELKVQLKQQAQALQKYAADILQGDFAVFRELEKLVKARQRQIQSRRDG